jgi:hypothetical protein
MPSKEVVSKVLAAVKTKADNVFFFENLKSVDWVTPLAEQGLFSDPPPGEETENGGIRFPPWPATQYLVRVVEQAPKLVVDVVSRIPQTDNPSIHRDIVSIALKVPPVLAKRLVVHALSGIESRGWNQEQYAGLFVHLARGGELESALRIARKLLEFLPDPDQEQKQASPETDDPLTWMRARLEPHPRSPVYLYQRILERYVPALAELAPLETVRLLAEILNEGIALGVRDQEKPSGQDWSSIWYPTLESPSHRIDSDAKAALTAALLRLIDQETAKNIGVCSTLQDILAPFLWRIFDRIRMRLAARCPAVSREKLREFALRLPHIEGADFNEEYFHLVKEHFGLLTDEEKRGIAHTILNGPDVQTLINQSFGGKPSSEQIKDYIRRWKIRHLYPIRAYLSPEEIDEYARLADGQTEPTYQTFVHSQGHRPIESMVWGPHSPKTDHELAEAEPQVVLDFLKTWESIKGYNSPSPEGLARAFQKAVAEQSSKFSAKAVEFTGIEPAYIRGLISGLAEAVKMGNPIDWSQTVKLCTWVVEQPVQIEGRSVENWDWESGDPNWRGARKATANLMHLGSYIGAGEIPFSLRNHVFAVIKTLTEDSDPAFAYEQEHSWKNQPATFAINTVRGEAMHALMGHAMWVHRHLAEPEQNDFNAMPEVRAILERKLDPQTEQTFAVRSVFGQYFPFLFEIDLAWVKKQLSLIFPPDGPQKQYRDVAWSTYVSFNRPHPKVFAILEKEYRRAIDNLEEPKGTEHDLEDPDESLTQHLVTLYTWGILTFQNADSILNKFYAVARDDLRAHAMDFIGKILDDDKSTLPEDAKARLMAFWERRIEDARAQYATKEYDKELLGFAWWLHSEKFDPIWMLEQTENVLRLCRYVEHEFLFTEPLASLSSRFPEKTVACLFLLVQKLKTDQSFILKRENIVTILNAGFSSADATTNQTAVAIKDSLLAHGNFEYRAVGN